MIIVLGAVFDIIHQVLVLTIFYPGEVAGIALVVAFLRCAITRDQPGGS